MTKPLAAAARTAAYRRDPRSVTERAAHAATERHVSLRPAPDTMCHLTALLPVAQGVAAYKALSGHADTLRAAGDPRGHGQLMADALVERTTGTPGGISGVEIQLVITDRTLFQGNAEPARLPGYGTVPAGWARERIAAPGRTPRTGTSRPGSGGSTPTPAPASSSPWTPRPALPPRPAPLHPGPRRHMPNLPYCDAPIRHLDHLIPWHTGGETTSTNGAGLCEACNHTKETPGWKARPALKPHPDPPRASARGTPSNSPPPPATRTVPPRRPCPDRLPAKRAWIPAAGAVMSATAPKRSSVCGPQAHWRPERRTGHKPSRAACTKSRPPIETDQRAASGQLVGGL